MTYEGVLKKMKADLNEIVLYQLALGNELVCMNDLLGRNITFRFLNKIYCIGCGKPTSKSFAQGFCFPCFKSAPETSECVMRPELCLAHEGISRNTEWSKGHCLQEHIVYFANTNGLKVGVTRLSQLPTRWIDQGAVQAVKFLKTPNRYTAGVAEVELKKYFSDKTNWRNMLSDKNLDPIDFPRIKNEASDLLPTEMKNFIIEENEITHIRYPILKFPQKIITVDFEKTTSLSGVLNGIKGQYLIFENGEVINIRKHNGFLIKLEID